MLCSDTGELEAIHIPGMKVVDAQLIAPALVAVRSAGNGNGEICIPLVNGFFDRIRIAITLHLESRRKKQQRVN